MKTTPQSETARRPKGPALLARSMAGLAILAAGCGPTASDDVVAQGSPCCDTAVVDLAIGVLLYDAADGLPVAGAPVLFTDTAGPHGQHLVSTDSGGYAAIVYEEPLPEGEYGLAEWVVSIDLPWYQSFVSGPHSPTASTPSILIEVGLAPL